MNIFSAKPEDYRKAMPRIHLSRENPSRIHLLVQR
jgi:hypothetical protein